ncbi:hypothetical protein [Lentzea flava]|uniref:Major facilitator superfamily (MFS) profile domain-containing protein n=1 Tax=Lentzea flava TaxID=103732 RepID=A0ABQ2UIC4_9PSEU|nr:hypothetical protein [Lentzea flava]MCP2199812.1 hypothetical protein [Lentzea flava]GGU38155.1 hypothetical protein GCM10010178_32970 [Lentzea flava]
MFAGLAVVLTELLGAAGGAAPLVVALLVIGSGAGLFASSFFTAALKVVRQQEVGSAAGLINAVHQFGGMLGVALLGSVYLGPGSGAAFWTTAALVVACFATGALMAGPKGFPPPLA